MDAIGQPAASLLLLSCRIVRARKSDAAAANRRRRTEGAGIFATAEALRSGDIALAGIARD
jgi:hypothetical protein